MEQNGYETWNRWSTQKCNISLLCDHVLFHHDQKNLFKNGYSAATVGSLRNKVLMVPLSNFIENIMNSNNPKQSLQKFNDTISEIFQLNKSSKPCEILD